MHIWLPCGHGGHCTGKHAVGPVLYRPAAALAPVLQCVQLQFFGLACLWCAWRVHACARFWPAVQHQLVKRTHVPTPAVAFLLCTCADCLPDDISKEDKFANCPKCQVCGLDASDYMR